MILLGLLDQWLLLPRTRPPPRMLSQEGLSKCVPPLKYRWASWKHPGWEDMKRKNFSTGRAVEGCVGLRQPERVWAELASGAGICRYFFLPCSFILWSQAMFIRLLLMDDSWGGLCPQRF